MTGPGPSGEAGGLDVGAPRLADAIHRYWRRDLGVVVALSAVWALAGLGRGAAQER